MSEPPNHNLLTVKETAEYLRIPLPTVYYLVQRGQIPAIQIGGRWRIKKSSLGRDILHQDKQGQPTVLVVDDDPGLQELFRNFLKKVGFSRVVVGTAKDAVANLKKQKFDLMFLDLQLPDAPGDQVYRNAKQIDPDLNVIVITGYPDSEMLNRILAKGPVTVLKKPLKVEQLKQAVRILGELEGVGQQDEIDLVLAERQRVGIRDNVRRAVVVERPAGEPVRRGERAGLRLCLRAAGRAGARRDPQPRIVRARDKTIALRHLTQTFQQDHAPGRQSQAGRERAQDSQRRALQLAEGQTDERTSAIKSGGRLRQRCGRF